MTQNLKTFLISIKIKMLYFYWAIKRYFIAPKFPVNKDGKVLVNLGCGVNTSKEFINVDTIPLPHIHHINNIQELFMFPDNSVDLLYASHVVEHIPRNELRKTLKDWRRVLKKGGILKIGVPDFDKLIEAYRLSGNNVDLIVNQVMGNIGDYNDHHSLWNFKYAKQLLEEAGFGDIRKWDYQNTNHHDFNDKTSRIMKIDNTDILISLNIEATKL